MTRIICSPEWDEPFSEESEDDWDEDFDPDRESQDSGAVYDEDDYGYDPYGEEEDEEEF